MPSALRDSLLLLCGLILGIVAGAAIILFLDLAPGEPQAAAPAEPAAEASGPAADAAPSAARQMGASAAPPVQAANAVACPVRPLLAPAGERDGQLLPPAEVTGKTIEEATRLLQTGKEAEAGGLLRDAEVAYLTACRIADARKGSGSAEAGTARAQLARHYAAVAASPGPAPASDRDALRQRAQAYYASALESLRATLGPAHETTRTAADGLAALQAPPAPAPQQPPTAAASAPAPQAAAQPAETVAAPSPPPAPAPPPPPPRPPERPPAQARATPEPARNAPVARAERPAPPRAVQERPVEVVEPRVRQATGDPGVTLRPDEADGPRRP